MSAKAKIRSAKNDINEQLNINYTTAIKSNKNFTANNNKSFDDLMTPLNLVSSANYKLT